jgi:hypothetical protein
MCSLFASAGETKRAVVYNDAARHNITLTARQIAIVRLASCFITTKFLRQRALQVEKHIEAPLWLPGIFPHSQV